MKLLSSSLLILLICFSIASTAQQRNNFNVIAYYSGGLAQLDSIDVSKITHIIYCFGHLKENRYHLNGARDTAMIRKMVSLKSKNQKLKVLVSLGGWGGCRTCSEVFSTAENRKAFAASVKTLNDYFKTDGIDLDWEYPTVSGYPGHRFAPEDKPNFTALVKELRNTLGKRNLVTFAAGGFQNFLDSAVEWKEVTRYVDFINLMTYDLISGYSTSTGHHTALYSLPQQRESTDNAVSYLLKIGVPANKLVIGAAFYGRMWENVPDVDNGLYQPGKFKTSISYKRFPQQLSTSLGYNYYWDDKAKAPYIYNAALKQFVTYDDKQSIKLKSQYVADKRLNGIMFWELSHDPYEHGLLHTIDSVKHHYQRTRK
jgi:chitinase